MLCIYFTSYGVFSLRAVWVTFDAPGWLDRDPYGIHTFPLPYNNNSNTNNNNNDNNNNNNNKKKKKKKKKKKNKNKKKKKRHIYFKSLSTTTNFILVT